MGGARTKHRIEITGGLGIESAEQSDSGTITDRGGLGTLTGFGVDSRGRKVLVGCHHVIAGMDTVNRKDRYRESPSHSRRVYQPDATDTSNEMGDGARRYRWVSFTWGEWEDTGKTSDGGKRKEQKRTASDGHTQTQWVDAPEVWPDWEDTGKTRRLGPDHQDGPADQKEQSRTSNHGNTQTRWVDKDYVPSTPAPTPTPEPTPTPTPAPTPSPSQPVTPPKPKPQPQPTPTTSWGPWRNVGSPRFIGPDELTGPRWVQDQERTSSAGVKETRVITTSRPTTVAPEPKPSPQPPQPPQEPEPTTTRPTPDTTPPLQTTTPAPTTSWGPWRNVGSPRFIGPSEPTGPRWVQDQERVSSAGTKETRVVTTSRPTTCARTTAAPTTKPPTTGAPVTTAPRTTTQAPETWGEWTDTGRTRTLGPNHPSGPARQKEQKRTSSRGRSETRWVTY